SYTVADDGLLHVAPSGLLANDIDPDGDPLRASLATPPSAGGVQLNVDGSFTYTAGPLFSGQDSFTYLVSDGRSAPATATVRLTGKPLNMAPVAGADS